MKDSRAGTKTSREINPFDVQLPVMERISPMGPEDIAVVAAMHQRAMGSSLWGQLGVGFLEVLYKHLLKHPSFIAYVYKESGQVKGFIAGSEDVSAMYKQTMLRHGASLGWAAVRALRKDLRLFKPLLKTGAYFASSGVDASVEAVKAESLFCSFERELRGKRISGHINKVLFDELALRGHKFVKVTTETDNKGAIRQLSSWGFEARGEFNFYNKTMVAYLLDLENSPRVEARRWTIL